MKRVQPRKLARPRLAARHRREHILRSALPLFAQRGFHGVSTKEIAAAAAVSEALIFKHFPTKRDIYHGLYAYCTRTVELDAARIEALPVETASAARVLYFVLRSIFIGHHAESLPTYRLFCHSCLDDGEFAALLLHSQAVRAAAAKFSACLEAGRRTGDIATVATPPVRLFWLARNIASHVFLHQLPARPAVRYGTSAQTLLRETIAFTLRGVGFSESSLQRFASAPVLRRWEKNPSLSLLAKPSNAANGAGAVAQ